MTYKNPTVNDYLVCCLISNSKVSVCFLLYYIEKNKEKYLEKQNQNMIAHDGSHF